MKVSVCITTLNEEGNIAKLLNSLMSQTKKPDEIIIIDAGSSDQTLSIISKYKKVKLIMSKNVSRSRGRNLGIKKARNNIIAITDAGCILNKYWLERISKPFGIKNVEIVAGFYKMTGKTDFQKALTPYLGVMPNKFNDNYLPSTRSIAVNRGVFKKVGDFPEEGMAGGEDTLFVYRAIKKNIEIARVKNAIVYWEVPNSIKGAFKKFFNYARWDAQTKIFWNPTKRFASHNIKAILVLLRYILGIIALSLVFKYRSIIYLCFTGFLIYLIWSFIKTYKVFRNIKIGLWGVVVQLIADMAVMSGFIVGFVG